LTSRNGVALAGGVRADGLHRGDRVAIMVRNSVNGSRFDPAAMGTRCGDRCTSTPHDPSENIARFCRTRARLWAHRESESVGIVRRSASDQLAGLKRVLALSGLTRPRLKSIVDWLPKNGSVVRQSSTRRHKTGDDHLHVGHKRASQGSDALASQHDSGMLLHPAVPERFVIG